MSFTHGASKPGPVFGLHAARAEFLLNSIARPHYPNEHTNVLDASTDATMPNGIGSRLAQARLDKLPGRTKEADCV